MVREYSDGVELFECEACGMVHGEPENVHQCEVCGDDFCINCMGDPDAKNAGLCLGCSDYFEHDGEYE